MISPVDDARSPAQDGFAPSAGPQTSSERPATSHAKDAERDEPHPLEPLLQQIGLVRESALHYFEAQKDATTTAARRLALKSALGIAAALVGGTALIACTVMVMDALAELVSLAAGNRRWAGNLVVGGGILIITAAVAALFVARWQRTSRAHTIQKYESSHNAQRQEFGTNISRRAAR
jgi:hypothetical protein